MEFQDPAPVPDQSLADRVRITFGHRTQTGQQIEPTRIRSATEYLLQVVGEVCGGAEGDDHAGSYHSSDGVTILENSTTVAGYGAALHDRIPTLRAAARWVGQYLGQRCVLLVIESTIALMIYVYADEPD